VIQALTGFDNLLRSGLVIRVAGKMTTEEFDQIGDPISVAILFSDEIQPGDDVRRLALFLELAFHRLESSAERIMWFSSDIRVRAGLVRQVAGSAIIELLGKEGAKVIDERFLVRRSGESGRSISRP